MNDPFQPITDKQIAVLIERVLDQRRELINIAGEMLATMKLPQNDEPLTEIGLRWKDIWDQWNRRFEKACGVHKREAKYHGWLEGHESYAIDYARGRAEMIEVMALCHACHNFIHNGRLFMMAQDGSIEIEKFWGVMKHGFGTLVEWLLPLNPYAVAVCKKMAKVDGWPEGFTDIMSEAVDGVYDGRIAKWSKWRLVIDGVEHKPIHKSIDSWEKHYLHGASLDALAANLYRGSFEDLTMNPIDDDWGDR